MKEFKLNIPLFIGIIGVLSALIVGLFFLLTGTISMVEIGKLLLNYSVITLPLALIWYLFENYGWRSKVWRFLRKFLNVPPNVSGRWEGTLNRIGENNPHKFVIEIKQTVTTIQIYTYSKNGKSESIIDNILTDKMKDNFQLCYLWEGVAGSLPGVDYKGGKFKGFTILNLIENGTERKLVGEYFTDRTPSQTKGEISLKWIGKELKQEY